MAQWSATYGPLAGCGPPRHFTRLTTFHCHPARDFFSFFNNRYAAINRRNDSESQAKTFLWSSPPIRPKKGQNFWRRLFFLVFAIDSSEKRHEFQEKIFLFWSAGMVAARWNLVGTECGPLVQKVADPFCSYFSHSYTLIFIRKSNRL